MIHVQFSNEQKKTIVAVFGSPQDPDFYDHLGEVDSNDDRLIDYYASIPESFVQRN